MKFKIMRFLREGLVSLSEISRESVYSREYLGYLVRQKKLKARKINGEWKTTKEWVKEFSDLAEEKKRNNRKELSKKLGQEEKKPILKKTKAKKIGFDLSQWKYFGKSLAVAGTLIIFLAIAGFVGADFSNWKNEAAKKILAAYDEVAQKAEEIFPDTDKKLADAIHALKLGTDKVNALANRVISKKKVDQYEKITGLAIHGTEEGKNDLVRSEEETMGGIIAGEQSAEPRGIVLAETTLLANVGDIEVDAYVLGSDNREIPNGEYDVRFSLYSLDRAQMDPYPSDTDQASRVWQETQTIKIQNGLLTTYLGGVNPIPGSLNFGSQIYYLGIRVGEDSELIPRKRIGAVPLARTALSALSTDSIAGYAVGNASGNIPISNGSLNTNLNAQYLDGMEAGDFATTADINNLSDYSGWRLQASSSDGGQNITSGGRVVFTGYKRNFDFAKRSDSHHCHRSQCQPHCRGTHSQWNHQRTTWNGSDIDISDYTNLSVGGTLLELAGDTLTVREGTLTNNFLCSYVVGTGLICDTDPTSIGVSYWNSNGNHIYNNNSDNVGIGTMLPRAPNSLWRERSVFLKEEPIHSITPLSRAEIREVNLTYTWPTGYPAGDGYILILLLTEHFPGPIRVQLQSHLAALSAEGPFPARSSISTVKKNWPRTRQISFGTTPTSDWELETQILNILSMSPETWE